VHHIRSILQVPRRSGSGVASTAESLDQTQRELTDCSIITLIPSRR
jgi:hypothetical protein